MPALVVVALIVVPIVELYLIIQAGQLLGVVPTLVLLVAMSLLGGFLLRREGARTWRALREALQAGRLPAQEVADGALVVLGGSLLLTPGFFTDVFGLLCVLPPSRAVLRRMLTGLVARRLGVAGVVGGLAADRLRQPGPTSRSTGGAGSDASGDVVDGEVVQERTDPPGPRGGTLPPA